MQNAKEHRELIEIAQQIVSHREWLAKPRVEALVLGKVQAATSNESLLAHLIAESLLKRIDQQLLASKNIYVEAFEIPQIVMFYRMAKAIPFVTVGHSIANQFLLHGLKNARDIRVLEIGIGSGLQMQGFLSYLSQRPIPPKSATIIGLDPDSSNLASCRSELEQRASRLGCKFEFRSACSTLESMDESQLQMLVEGEGALAINASFALHHTHHEVGDVEARTQLLARLRRLNPTLITLVEPNSNHDTEALAERIDQSWRHFGVLFDLVDRSSLDAGSKFAIKEMFFGREIRDIFGVSDHFRTERHERTESWILRLAKAGFEPVQFTDVSVNLPEYCDCEVGDGLARMSYYCTNLVTAFAFQPKRGD
ncbi:MAG: hypothetical protein AUK47_09010 [Deltaproteobacteria bacterium CG2_30_63_29]|nr:MAG: hypothetical protein AUK47_09010 [Deltaproteobacteria bacterium CG2_30_63_29]PJB42323.1 MAG: hypothetical protein CO108_11940 [Deltaproteobacteria bacterium CG_4_9_14_3_um_filter_63_12]